MAPVGAPAGQIRSDQMRVGFHEAKAAPTEHAGLLQLSAVKYLERYFDGTSGGTCRVRSDEVV